MATRTTREVSTDRVSKLIQVEEERFRKARSRSHGLWDSARDVLPRGVPSSFQDAAPHPIFVDHGRGSLVWDVDGNQYVDFHNGFGVMVVGHAHPAIVRAVAERAARGSHFAAPTEGSIAVAEELRRRWGLPHWRFTNSGTESTMDAIHLARGFTGREAIVKIEGTYHGHHDAVMVSVKPPADLMGERDRPASVAYGLGYPPAVTPLTRAVPFNDAAALERALAELDGGAAGVILEPAMM